MQRKIYVYYKHVVSTLDFLRYAITNPLPPLVQSFEELRIFEERHNPKVESNPGHGLIEMPDDWYGMSEDASDQATSSHN